MVSECQKKLFLAIIAQGDAKLWAIKVRGWIKILAQVELNLYLLGKSDDTLDFSSTLTCHSFAALCAMMMNTSSFKIPKPYLFALNLKNNIVALWRYTIIHCEKNKSTFLDFGKRGPTFGSKIPHKFSLNHQNDQQ